MDVLRVFITFFIAFVVEVCVMLLFLGVNSLFFYRLKHCFCVLNHAFCCVKGHVLYWRMYQVIRYSVLTH